MLERDIFPLKSFYSLHKRRISCVKMIWVVVFNVRSNITGITRLSSSDMVIIVVELCLISVWIVFVEGG